MGRTCPVCGKPIPPKHTTFCSRACYTTSRYHYRDCVICGARYQSPPSSLRVCCSPACSRQHRRNLCATDAAAETTAKMLAAKSASPLTKRGPLNAQSKYWVICSPSGKVYRCRNLLHWCREHADLLDGTPHQAWDGLSKIKYTEQGKRPKCKSKSWKGWTLLDWGD